MEIFNGVWDPFIWPCVGVWILDRIVRVFRILSFDIRFWNTKCTAIYDSDSNLVRLDIPCTSSKGLSKPKPGTYYYIYVFNDAIYLHQNHPFTLAYIKHSGEAASERLTGHSACRPSFERYDSDSSTESDVLLSNFSQDSPSSSSSSLVFLVRPYDGFTSRLKNYAAAGPTSLNVLVEGPYGETNPLHTFSSILFVVGGTGIAAPLSYLASLLESTSKTTRIHILWAVREHGFLTNVLERDFREILKERGADDKLVLTVHVTQEATEEGKDEDLGEGMQCCLLKAGRPDVYAAVEEEAELEVRGGLAVVACGPAQMADDARRATVDALTRGHRGIEYFEESFKW